MHAYIFFPIQTHSINSILFPVICSCSDNLLRFPPFFLLVVHLLQLKLLFSCIPQNSPFIHAATIFVFFFFLCAHATQTLLQQQHGTVHKLLQSSFVFFYCVRVCVCFLLLSSKVYAFRSLKRSCSLHHPQSCIHAATIYSVSACSRRCKRARSG